jgi:hypothetical protein
MLILMWIRSPVGGEIIPQRIDFSTFSFGIILRLHEIMSLRPSKSNPSLHGRIATSQQTLHAMTYQLEKTLSRLIKTDTAGKDRTKLTKAIVLAVRELAKQKDVTDEAKDLAAFIALALQTISDGIDESVAAWEKRGYWVKADRFRMDWLWTGQTASKMKNAVLTDDWGTIAMLMPQIAAKLGKIQIAENHRLGKPWVGVFERLKTEG